MKTLHIHAVDLVRDGLVVTYNDQSRAFYDESVLMAHLNQTAQDAGRQTPLRKRPRSVPAPSAPDAAARGRKRFAG